MSARTFDLDRALRAAGGVADADIPSLSRDVIAELAAETVETIAWTFDEGTPHSAVTHAWNLTRSRRRIALAAALTLTAGGAAFAVFAGSDRSAAPLGWQPVPISVPDAAQRAAAAACIRELEPPGRSFKTPGFKLTDPLLSEQRGRTVFTVLANNTGFGDCLTLDGRGDGAGLWYAPNGYPHPSATEISLSENGTSWTMDVHDKRVDTTMLAGFAGSAVTRIAVLRTDGVTVTASIHDGLWAAWWPGTWQAASVTVHTRDGRSVTLPIGRVTVVPPSPASSPAPSAP